MSLRQSPETLLANDEIVAAPLKRSCEDQTFELPAGIYVAMASMFVGFVMVLALAFRGGHMPVVYGVVFAFIGAFFAVPALFPSMAPDSHKALSWFNFQDRGIMTATGRTSAREASILVLLLPFLIFCFGVAVAVTASLV